MWPLQKGFHKDTTEGTPSYGSLPSEATLPEEGIEEPDKCQFRPTSSLTAEATSEPQSAALSPPLLRLAQPIEFRVCSKSRYRTPGINWVLSPSVSAATVPPPIHHSPPKDGRGELA